MLTFDRERVIVRQDALQHLIAPGRSPSDHNPPSVPLTLHAFRTEGDHVMDGVLVAPDHRWWWVAAGVPRLLPPEMYRNDALAQTYAKELTTLNLRPHAPLTTREKLHKIQTKTIDRFGAEWLHFRDWGYHATPPNGDALEYQGGLWSNTLAAFRAKTFLDDKLHGKLVLDAGCGNGRFSAAALASGARGVLSVDIGWGVDATFEHHRDDPRVHVVQASLFDLPIRAVDSAFSLGVLMHTGDAARAFAHIARLIAPGGLFAVRLYHRGNWAYERTDAAIRSITTRLTKPAQLRFARRMATLGSRLISSDATPKRAPDRLSKRARWYQVLRNWPTVHHNLDWWTAPVATHHTVREVKSWGQASGLCATRTDPDERPTTYSFWDWPEALTVLFQRPIAAELGPASTVREVSPRLVMS